MQKRKRSLLVLLMAGVAVGAFFTAALVDNAIAQQDESLSKQPTPPPQKVSADVLAQVNDRMISVQEFSELIANIAPPLRAFVKAQKARYLQGIVEEELLFQEAKKKKIDISPDIVLQLDQAKKRLIVGKLIQEEIKNKIQVSDQEIQDYYQKNSPLYHLRERARLSQIVVKDKKRAQDILARLKKGEDFAVLASANSLDSSKAKGGSLGFVERGSMGEVFDKAAFSLKPGDISPIIETAQGYQIIKMLENLPARTRPLTEVSDGIKKELFAGKEKQALRQYVEELKKNANVIVQEDLLKKIQ